MSPGARVLAGMIGAGPETEEGRGKYGDNHFVQSAVFSLSRMVKNFSRLGKRFYLLFGRTNSAKTNEKTNRISYSYIVQS